VRAVIAGLSERKGFRGFAAFYPKAASLSSDFECILLTQAGYRPGCLWPWRALLPPMSPFRTGHFFLGAG